MLQWLSATIGAVVGEVVAQSSESGASVAANATKNNDLDQELSTEFGHIPKTEKEVMEGEEQNLDNKYEITFKEFKDAILGNASSTAADATMKQLLSKEFPAYQRIEPIPGSNNAFRIYYPSGGKMVSSVVKNIPLVSGGILLVNIGQSGDKEGAVFQELSKFTLSRATGEVVSHNIKGPSGTVLAVIIGGVVEVSIDRIAERIRDISMNGVDIK